MQNKRQFLKLALVLGVGALASPSFASEAYPNRPIRLIVPFAPGGPTDIMGRVVGKIITDTLKQPVVIENRPGAGGNLGTDVVAKSPADGYTLGIGAISSLAISPGLYAKLPYDVNRDFTPITMVGVAKGAIVAHPSLPFNDLKGLIAYAKAHPGQLSYASPGIGTSSHLAAEYLQSVTGIQLTHVPYKGTSAAAQDVLAGRVPLSFESSLTMAAQNINLGKIKGIALTARGRSPLLPNLPTVEEQGIANFDVPTWFGLIGPAGLPKDVVATLNRAVTEGLKSAAVVERFAAISAEPTPTTPERFDAYIKEEAKRWGQLIKAANIKAE